MAHHSLPSAWPQNLFDEAGRVEEAVLQELQNLASQPSQPASLAISLSLPADYIASSVKNRCEAALLLEIGHYGFKLDKLVGWEREKAYHEKVITDCKEVVEAVSLPIPNYPIPTVLHNEYAPSLPILNAALAKVQQQRAYLINHLNQTLVELARHRTACAQFAEMNLGMAKELAKAGVTSLATAKLILADVQRALVSRITSIGSGSDLLGDDLKPWDVLLDEIRQRRHLDASLSISSDLPNHISDTFDYSRKRKRTDDSLDRDPGIRDVKQARTIVPETPQITTPAKRNSLPNATISPAGSEFAVVDETTLHVGHVSSSSSAESPSIITRANLVSSTTIAVRGMVRRPEAPMIEVATARRVQFERTEISTTTNVLNLRPPPVPENVVRSPLHNARQTFGESFVMTSTPFDPEGVGPALQKRIRDSQGSHTTISDAEGCLIEIEMPSLSSMPLPSGRHAVRGSQDEKDDVSDRSTQPIYDQYMSGNEEDDLEGGDAQNAEAGATPYHMRTPHGSPSKGQECGIYEIDDRPSVNPCRRVGVYPGRGSASRHASPSKQPLNVHRDSVGGSLSEHIAGSSEHIKLHNAGRQDLSSETVSASSDCQRKEASSHAIRPDFLPPITPPTVLRRVRSEMTERERRRTLDPFVLVNKENATSLLDPWSPILPINRRHQRPQSAPPSPTRGSEQSGSAAGEPRILKESPNSSSNPRSSLQSGSGEKEKERWAESQPGESKASQGTDDPTPPVISITSEDDGDGDGEMVLSQGPAVSERADGEEDQEGDDERENTGEQSQKAPVSGRRNGSSPTFYTCLEAQASEEG